MERSRQAKFSYRELRDFDKSNNCRVIRDLDKSLYLSRCRVLYITNCRSRCKAQVQNADQFNIQYYQSKKINHWFEKSTKAAWRVQNQRPRLTDKGKSQTCTICKDILSHEWKALDNLK